MMVLIPLLPFPTGSPYSSLHPDGILNLIAICLWMYIYNVHQWIKNILTGEYFILWQVLTAYYSFYHSNCNRTNIYEWNNVPLVVFYTVMNWQQTFHHHLQNDKAKNEAVPFLPDPKFAEEEDLCKLCLPSSAEWQRFAKLGKVCEGQQKRTQDLGVGPCIGEF